MSPTSSGSAPTAVATTGVPIESASRGGRAKPLVGRRPEQRLGPGHERCAIATADRRQTDDSPVGVARDRGIDGGRVVALGPGDHEADVVGEGMQRVDGNRHVLALLDPTEHQDVGSAGDAPTEIVGSADERARRRGGRGAPAPPRCRTRRGPPGARAPTTRGGSRPAAPLGGPDRPWPPPPAHTTRDG